MKTNPQIIAVLAAAALMVGCQKEATTSQKLDQAQEKTAEAVQDMKDYTYAQKAQFVEKTQAQLAELDRELDQLEARIAKSNAAAKAEHQPKLEALRNQTAKLKIHLDEVKNASESTWDSVKSSFKQAYESSKEGFQQSRQWLSDKIAP